MGNQLQSPEDKLIITSINITLDDYKKEETESSIYNRISIIFDQLKEPTIKSLPYYFSTEEIIRTYYRERCRKLFNEIAKDNPEGKLFIRTIKDRCDFL